MELERTGLEIAVIGMALRTPGASNVEEFWEVLKNGRETLCFFSDEELSQVGINGQLLEHPGYIKAKGVMEGKKYFDAHFFGYVPEEARIMHPQARIFHECAWTALENAGYSPASYQGAIGIYAGGASSFNFEVLTLLKSSDSIIDSFSAGHLKDKDFLSTRIAYKFGLKGPAIAVQSACSTSLVAIHMACRGLLSGECNIALAGGVSVSQAEKTGYMLQDGLPYSRDGHVRTFDKQSSGVIAGEGVGLVVLKSLDDAIEDGDTIHAIIKGSAINNDGNRKVGYATPSVLGQAEVIRAALHMAEVEAETITYVEAHGTATDLGDAVEVEALKKAFESDKKQFCRIGSLKSNMGHLDMAAGVSGVIKTVLALEHKLIPPSLHYEAANPTIDFLASPFLVNTQLTSWKTNGFPLRAGVSAFGIGGTNAHVILEEAPPVEESSPSSLPYHLLLLSAKTMNALERGTQQLTTFLTNHPGINLADVCYTLQVGRDPFRYRRMLLTTSIDDAIANLKDNPEHLQTNDLSFEKSSIVFMFSGHDIPYLNMGAELYNNIPLFKEYIDQGFKELTRITKVNVKPFIYPNDEILKNDEKRKQAEALIAQVGFASPIKFIFEYAVIKLIMSWGIVPNAMIGHSLGEYSAACLAGVFSFEEGIQLVSIRAKLIDSLPEAAMMSVTCSEEKLRELLTTNDQIDIAVISSEERSMVSGTRQAIEQFKKQLKEKRIGGVIFPVSKGGHSRQMDPILNEFETAVRKITLKQPTIPFISGLSGKWIKSHEATDPVYWRRHLRETMRFHDGLTEVLKLENVMIIQPGSERTLITLANQHQHKKSHNLVISLIRHAQEEVSDLSFLLQKIGLLWMFGVVPDWQAFYAEEKRHRIPLPTYSFDRKAYWIDGDPFQIAAAMFQQQTLSNHKREFKDWFYVPSWKRVPIPLYKTDQAKELNCLVFSDGNESDSGFISKLKPLVKTISVVRKGASFSSENPHSYVIEPRDKEHYQRLFTELRGKNCFPHRIVYLGVLSGPEKTSANHDLNNDIQTFAIAFSHFMYVVEALINLVKNGQIQAKDSIELIVVSDFMQDVVGNEPILPYKSLILGVLESIHEQYPQLICRSIDIVNQERGDLLDQHVLNEIFSMASHRVVAFRHNLRWVSLIEPVKLEHHHNPEEPYPYVKKRGVYLFVGDGKPDSWVYALATQFIERFDAILLFTALNADDSILVKKTIQQLATYGSHLVMIEANPVDALAMTEAIRNAQAHYGQIAGLVYSGDFFAPGLDKENPELLFSGMQKVSLFEQILALITPRFVAICSSSQDVPSPDVLDFNRANHFFMNAYVYFKRMHSAKNMVNINWYRFPMNESQPMEIIESFLSVLSGDLERVFVSPWDLRAILTTAVTPFHQVTPVLEEEEIQESSGLNRPALSTIYVAPRNDPEKKMVVVWQSFFGIEPIGIDDNFFELGGDSLKAMSIVSYIFKSTNIKIPLPQLFKLPTIRKLVDYLTALNSKTSGDSYSAIEKAEEKEYYVLSSAQKRLYILQQLETNSTAYNVPQVLPLQTSVDLQKVEEIFKRLMKRHESMRTAFFTVNEEPVQKIYDAVPFKIETYQVTDSSPIEIEKQIKRVIRPFDLSQPPLFRVALITAHDGRQVLILDMHHIISDATSNHLLVDDFKKMYPDHELPPLPLQYKDYSEWQNSPQQRELLKQQEKYWLNQYQDQPPLLDLPIDYPRPAIQSFAGDEFDFSLDSQTTAFLREIAQQHDATLFIVLFAVFNVFLARVSGGEDIVVGTQILGRRHPDLQPIMGMFVNALALRNYPVSTKTFREFLKELRQRTLDAFENQEFPFEELVEKISVRRDTSRNPIFDVSFALHNFQKTEGRHIQAELEQSIKNKYKTFVSRFDLTLTGLEAEEKLFFTLEYSTKLFKEETIKRFVFFFTTIIDRLKGDLDIALSDISIVSEEEKKIILEDFNASDGNYQKDRSLLQLFEEQVEKEPQRIAILDMAPSGISLTYIEVQERVGVIATLLRENGVTNGTIVAIMADRSPDMVLGILGIMKAGAAYLPILPQYPSERIRYILADSQAKVLLTQTPYIEKVSSIGISIPVFALESEFCRLGRIGEFNFHCVPEDLAYVIYTSGSTGNPKGVAIKQGAAVNIITALQEYYPLNHSDVYLLKTSFLFDVSVTELFGWFIGGGSLAVLVKDGEKDPLIILDTIKRASVTHINFVPSMFNFFVNILDHNTIANISSLKYIFLAGEAILAESIHRFRRFNTTIKLENIYGPTENTIYASRYSLEHWNGIGSVPIGQPVRNVKLYVVDKKNNIQPIGIVGELCISGLGVAIGYLNNPLLTAEKFVANPFTFSGDHALLYRTGDLARWRTDGNIEFLGRIDHQVKIRGFRIEIGEIESLLVKCKGIKEGVVIERSEPGGEKYLCAYVVSPAEIDVQELRNALLKHLPEYMSPSYFVQIEQIPLSASGKLNRNELPDPLQKIGKDNSYIAPRNEMEKKLTQIWSEVLHIDQEKIGIDAPFFQLGGHSLKATILASKIHKEFNVVVPLVEIFKKPSIRWQAELIKATPEYSYEAIQVVEEKEYYPLSPAQQRMYIVNQMYENNISYNMTSFIVLKDEIEIGQMEKVFQDLIARHESFRTSFEMVDGLPVQKVWKQADFKVQCYEVEKNEIKRTANNFVKPFDLSHPPLIRIGYMKIKQGDALLMSDIHHIISDGFSISLLMQEFMTLYRGGELAPLRIQYKDYAHWLNSETQQKEILKQQEFWLHVFSGNLPVVDLPTDFPRPLQRSIEGGILEFMLDSEESQKLKQLCQQEHVTLFMAFLAVFTILISKITGREDIIIGTPLAGRGHADLYNIIGMFVNMLALRNFPNAEKSFQGFLAEVKERIMEYFNNQYYPFEDLVEKLGIQRDPARTPIFDIVFSFQEQDKEDKKVQDESAFEPELYDFGFRPVQYDWILTGTEKTGKIMFSMEYSIKLFKEERIKRYIGYFKEVLSSVLDNSSIAIKDIPISVGQDLLTAKSPLPDLDFNL